MKFPDRFSRYACPGKRESVMHDIAMANDMAMVATPPLLQPLRRFLHLMGDGFKGHCENRLLTTLSLDSNISDGVEKYDFFPG